MYTKKEIKPSEYKKYSPDFSEIVSKCKKIEYFYFAQDDDGWWIAFLTEPSRKNGRWQTPAQINKTIEWDTRIKNNNGMFFSIDGDKVYKNERKIA